MKTKIFLTLLIPIVISSCQKEVKQDPFEISNNRIGLLTHEVMVSQLDSVFATDSITKRVSANQYLAATNEIEVYDKGGNKLLILEASDQSDPASTIESIQVIDARYKTNSGLSANSTFKDIKEHYNISKINNTLSTAVIFVDSIQAYFTIDKKQLPGKFQSNTDLKIEVTDIPDSAKIKNFWISWDKN